MTTNVHVQQYLAEFFIKKKFETKFLEKIRNYCMLNNWFPKIAAFEIIWKNMVKPVRPHMTI
jgi:hypothetical protein